MNRKRMEWLEHQHQCEDEHDEYVIMIGASVSGVGLGTSLGYLYFPG